MRKKSRERYKNLSEEEKNKIKEYQRKRYQELIQYKKEALKNKQFFVSFYYKRMSENTLKFNNIRLDKNEFHKSKHPIDLSLVSVDQVVVSDKFKHSDKGFKHFIGYKEGEIVKPLCIILLQMSGYIKYFENGGKNMSLFMEDDKICEKYKQIWDAIKNKLGIKFHSKPIYEEKYLKVKVKEFDGVVKTNFLSNGIPKENMHYTCIACITIDSVMKIGKENYPQSLFRRV